MGRDSYAKAPRLRSVTSSRLMLHIRQWRGLSSRGWDAPEGPGPPSLKLRRAGEIRCSFFCTRGARGGSRRESLKTGEIFEPFLTFRTDGVGDKSLFLACVAASLEIEQNVRQASPSCKMLVSNHTFLNSSLSRPPICCSIYTKSAHIIFLDSK